MNNTTITVREDALIALLKQHDKKGISILYDHYSAALLGVIHRVVNDHEVAEEILQDVFVKIWQRSDQYDSSKGRLFTWTLNIARNAAIDFIRVKKNQHKNQDIDNVVHRIDEHNQLIPSVDSMDMKKIAATLEPNHRSIIDLIYFNGYTQMETAEALQIPLGTVKTRLRNALIQLRKLF